MATSLSAESVDTSFSGSDWPLASGVLRALNLVILIPESSPQTRMATNHLSSAENAALNTSLTPRS